MWLNVSTNTPPPSCFLTMPNKKVIKKVIWIECVCEIKLWWPDLVKLCYIPLVPSNRGTGCKTNDSFWPIWTDPLASCNAFRQTGQLPSAADKHNKQSCGWKKHVMKITTWKSIINKKQSIIGKNVFYFKGKQILGKYII